RRLDDPQHASSPGVEGVTLLGVELVQIVNPMQPLLPVTDAQLGDMWRRAELRQTGAERPPQIVQRPVRDRLAAVELGDTTIKPLLGANVVDLRAADHIVLAARELSPKERAQDIDRRRRQRHHTRLGRLRPPWRDDPPPGDELVELQPGGATELGAPYAQ